MIPGASGHRGRSQRAVTGVLAQGSASVTRPSPPVPQGSHDEPSPATDRPRSLLVLGGADRRVRGLGPRRPDQPGHGDDGHLGLDHHQLQLGLHPARVRGAGPVHRAGRPPVGPDPARAGRLPAGVPHVLLGVDDVRRRTRRRAAVLRHRRTHLALGRTAARTGRPAEPGSGRGGAALHLLPLGLQRLGAVRGDGRCDGLLLVPQGHADPGQRNLHPHPGTERP